MYALYLTIHYTTCSPSLSRDKVSLKNKYLNVPIVWVVNQGRKSPEELGLRGGHENTARGEKILQVQEGSPRSKEINGLDFPRPYTSCHPRNFTLYNVMHRLETTTAQKLNTICRGSLLTHLRHTDTVPYCDLRRALLINNIEAIRCLWWRKLRGF